MPDLLTTDEAAIYLRLSPRKLYELLAKGAVPCTKVTGRWLFPRAALDRWVMAGLITSAAFPHATAPPIVGGSHDLLLELTLRESGCGLASLPEGSEAGLQRLARRGHGCGDPSASARWRRRGRKHRSRRCCAGPPRCRRDLLCAARARDRDCSGESAQTQRYRLSRKIPCTPSATTARRRRATAAARVAGAR